MSKRNILDDKVRVYGAACESERTARLLSQIRNLGIKDWKIAVEKPGNPDEYGKILLDPPSRRFRHQLTVDVDRPFMWLEDDACILPDFQDVWKPFNDSLPRDWKIAVIGWGFLYEDEGVEWTPVNDHWVQLCGGSPHWGAYCGAHCTIVKSGKWRLKLAKHMFRCDSGLAGAMKAAKIPGSMNGLYLSRTILVGAGIGEWNNTTFGNLSAAYPVYTTPRWFSQKRHDETGNGFRPIDEM